MGDDDGDLGCEEVYWVFSCIRVILLLVRYFLLVVSKSLSKAYIVATTE